MHIITHDDDITFDTEKFIRKKWNNLHLQKTFTYQTSNICWLKMLSQEG